MSFLISFAALSLDIINDFVYKFTISLISLTLIISPFWIVLIEKVINPGISKNQEEFTKK
ncbi:hypothetical protein GCM10022393_10650 [Aquimarina addita]|uniref:Uncharacterized protein n=1 Tax=Aquimarina addita TaxID=870485 RepID=A0ABP7XDJ8_9FLAO